MFRELNNVCSCSRERGIYTGNKLSVNNTVLPHNTPLARYCLSCFLRTLACHILHELPSRFYQPVCQMLRCFVLKKQGVESLVYVTWCQQKFIQSDTTLPLSSVWILKCHLWAGGGCGVNKLFTAIFTCFFIICFVFGRFPQNVNFNAPSIISWEPLKNFGWNEIYQGSVLN